MVAPAFMLEVGVSAELLQAHAVVRWYIPGAGFHYFPSQLSPALVNAAEPKPHSSSGSRLATTSAISLSRRPRLLLLLLLFVFLLPPLLPPHRALTFGTSQLLARTQQ